MELPTQFEERVRPDIVKRAVLSIQSKNRQKYGADPEAGLRHVVRWRQRNNAYRSRKGRGQSRIPRKVMHARGMQIYGEGAESPSTRGGRAAHPPKAEKDFEEEINDKERRKAIRSAITATTKEDLVQENHRYNGEVPLVEEGLEDLKKTKEVQEKLEELGLEEELDRAADTSFRAGQGSNRGRKYNNRTGPLLVLGEHTNAIKAAQNIPGVDAVTVENLNAQLLSSGVKPGRLTVWSQEAVDRLEEENLFR